MSFIKGKGSPTSLIVPTNRRPQTLDVNHKRCSMQKHMTAKPVMLKGLNFSVDFVEDFNNLLSPLPMALFS